MVNQKTFFWLCVVALVMSMFGCETLRHPTESEFDAARDVLNEWENPDIAPSKPIERQRTLWVLEQMLGYWTGDGSNGND